MAYYIKQTEPGLYTVGCNQPEWEPFEDCNDKEEAVKLCIKLNGGTVTEIPEDLREFLLDIYAPRRGSEFEKITVDETILVRVETLITKYKIKT